MEVMRADGLVTQLECAQAMFDFDKCRNGVLRSELEKAEARLREQIEENKNQFGTQYDELKNWLIASESLQEKRYEAMSNTINAQWKWFAVTVVLIVLSMFGGSSLASIISI